MKDNVKCCNCSKRVLVKCGTSTCPLCGFNGGLSWVDGEPQEVEDGYKGLPSYDGARQYSKAVDIEWDVDDDADAEDLPTEIDIPEGMTDLDDISDYLSDQTGFCHLGFRLA